MQLADYLARIGYTGPVAPTLECFTGIHRRQALSVPYEALDVQFGRTVDRDVERIFDRIVRRRRGGWCYEVHELLAWALREIGFSVRLVVGGVHRRDYGDVKLGNHMPVLVDLDQTYLADIGLADGIRDPIPLKAGVYHQGRLSFRLERLADDYWRFHNHAYAYPANFDFRDEPIDYALIDRYIEQLSTGPESGYVLNLICQIMQEESVTCLTGRVLRHKTPDGMTKRLITEEEFEDVIADLFGIRDPELGSLWPKVEARHRELFGDTPVEQLNVTGL